jgi:Fe-S oxidoreductase
MVVLEPSCCSVFRDEMRSLLPESAAAQQLSANTFTLSELLEKKAPGYRPPQMSARAIVQGHCHHKAIMRMKDEKMLMEKMGLDYEVLESGCCGMAGSFGYEQDKYSVSVACGERALLPRVRDGFSCKEQIAQQTERQALHLAQVMQLALHDDGAPRSGTTPEAKIVRLRKQRQRKSMLQAGFVTAGVLAAGVFGLNLGLTLGVKWWRRRR